MKKSIFSVYRKAWEEFWCFEFLLFVKLVLGVYLLFTNAFPCTINSGLEVLMAVGWFVFKIFLFFLFLFLLCSGPVLTAEAFLLQPLFKKRVLQKRKVFLEEEKERLQGVLDALVEADKACFQFPYLLWNERDKWNFRVEVENVYAEVFCLLYGERAFHHEESSQKWKSMSEQFQEQLIDPVSVLRAHEAQSLGEARKVSWGKIAQARKELSDSIRRVATEEMNEAVEDLAIIGDV